MRFPSKPARLPIITCAVIFSLSTAPALSTQPTQRDAARESDLALLRTVGIVESPRASRDFPGWQRPKLVVTSPFRADAAQWLQTAAPPTKIVVANSVEHAVELAKTADVVLGFCSQAVVDAGTKLRWIQTANAGVESCVAIPRVREGHILLTNMQRVAGPAMAEHGLALLLALTRGLPQFIANQPQGMWQRNDRNRTSLQTIEGKTLFIAGLGGIGTEVARRAHALGMNVIATRASDKPIPPFVTRVGKPADLIAFAKEADAIVAALPLTADTRHIFDAKFFAAMKPSAYFINLGRGKSVVTDDLVAALEKRTIAGAGLDVTDPEPLPSDHPLWRAPNIIITPHISADSDRDEPVRAAVYRENLRRYAAGDPLLSVVDTQAGY